MAVSINYPILRKRKEKRERKGRREMNRRKEWNTI